MQLCLLVGTQDFDRWMFRHVFGPLRCTTQGELQTKCTESAWRVHRECEESLVTFLGALVNADLPAMHWNEELGPTEGL